VLEQIVGPDTDRRGLSLYRVEVEADHRPGYAYLRPGELARTCPLLWPNETHLVMNEPFHLQIDAEDENCLLPGPAKRLEDLLSKSCKANRAILNKAKRLDVDGDKRPDRLVEVGHVLAIVRNRATGWVADPVSILHEGSNREEHVWQDTLIAGEAVYVRSVDYAWENFPDETNDDGSVIPAERDQSNTASLFRVLADGKVYEVFEHFYSGDVGECNFTGHQDQSVTLRCSQGRVRLRWDEKLKRLIPTLDAK
jgi:hypothetical protein